MKMDQDSSVGIANRYGLGGPGMDSRWRPGFPHPSTPDLRPTQPPVKLVPSLFPGVKRPGCSFNHPIPSSTEVKEKVELYFYSSSRSSWPVLEWILTFLLYTVYNRRLPIRHHNVYSYLLETKTNQTLEVRMIFVRISPIHNVWNILSSN
jgi:hypothetical protein